MKISFTARWKAYKNKSIIGKLDCVEPAAIMHNNKLIGIGRKCNCTGTIYRLLFASNNMLKRAQAIQAQAGKIRIAGKIIENNTLAVMNVFYPKSAIAKYYKRERLVEQREYDEFMRDNCNINFTGHHRSNDKEISPVNKVNTPPAIPRRWKKKKYHCNESNDMLK